MEICLLSTKMPLFKAIKQFNPDQYRSAIEHTKPKEMQPACTFKRF